MAYDVFVSHAWSYSDRYLGTVGLLDAASVNLRWFSYRNYSVPKHDPIVDPDENVRIAKLRGLLKEQIRQASVVIVPAGMYVNHRYWIQEELRIAQTGFLYKKPVVAIRRRGQQRDPEDLMAMADAAVNWNSTSLAEAIRDVCR
jgi:hypothetical protein